MNLIVDIGNTNAKIAVFEANKLLEKINVSLCDISLSSKKFQEKYNLTGCIVSSVSNYNASALKNNFHFSKFIELDNSTKVPFKNKYKSPNTLGVDRIALASAAATIYPNKNILVIDAGTCITYDFINDKKEYLGGAISPGISIRYKSLHNFTAKLPLLEKNKFSLIGTDTKGSIHSGVLNGVVQEIDGVINQYLTKNQTLTIVLTGGDAIFLAKNLKSTIFANPNFLLEGLNSILIYNFDE